MTKIRILIVVAIIITCAGCAIKWADKEISFFQMQVRKDSASIYSTKLYGIDLAFPIPMPTGSGDMRLRLGYGGETKSLIPVKADGELPNILIDLSTTHGSNTNDLSDTYATGDPSLSIYPEETTEVEVK